jgi:hypothetical protein
VTTRSTISTADRPEAAARFCSQARFRQVVEHHFGIGPLARGSLASVDTEHNRSFRTHLGYQRAFRTLALGGPMRSRQKHLPDVAKRALAEYGTNINARSLASVDEEEGDDGHTTILVHLG